MVGTFSTKKERKKKGLKGQITQVNEGRVEVICESLTQVNEGRVQVIRVLLTQVREDRVKDICKSLTQVNKGRGTDKGCSPGSKRQGINYNFKNQFSKLEGTNRKTQVLQQRKQTEKPRKPVFPVGNRK